MSRLAVSFLSWRGIWSVRARLITMAAPTVTLVSGVDHDEPTRLPIPPVLVDEQRA